MENLHLEKVSFVNIQDKSGMKSQNLAGGSVLSPEDFYVNRDKPVYSFMSTFQHIK